MVVIVVIIVIVVISYNSYSSYGSNSSYNCTPFLHSLLTKARSWAGRCWALGFGACCRTRRMGRRDPASEQ